MVGRRSNSSNTGPGRRGGQRPNYTRPTAGGTDGGSAGNSSVGGSTGTGGGSGCKCPMRAAVVSIKRGKFRLARRYAAWSARLILARLT